MGKKGVPEWLNSSIWSSSSSSSAATVAAASASHPADRLPRSLPLPKPEPPVQAVIPPPPPRPASPPRREAPRLSSGTLPGDPNPARLSEEDVSRQSQLLSEVYTHFSTYCWMLLFQFFHGYDLLTGVKMRAQLSKKVINIEELRKLASQGIPDGAGIRSTIWKVPTNSFSFTIWSILS